MYLFIVFSFYIYPGEKLLQALRFCDELCVRREADMEDIPWVSDLSSRVDGGDMDGRAVQGRR